MTLFDYIGLSTLKNFLKDHGENVKKLEFFPFIYHLLVNPTYLPTIPTSVTIYIAIDYDY